MDAPGVNPERGRQMEITRVRNEIAFIHSQRACGGPERTEEMERWQKRLQELTGPESRK